MTGKEAIKKLEKSKKAIQVISSDYIAFDLAIEALEKQVPKKLKVADVGYKMFGCPNCDYADSIWSLGRKDKYCPNCGQAISWEVEGK